MAGDRGIESGDALDVSMSDGFTGWLADNDVAIALATRAPGKLALIGARADSSLSVSARHFDGVRALAARGGTVLMATGHQMWRLDNALARGQTADGYDRLYVPQTAYTIGEIGAADPAFARNGGIVFVSTVFSCIAAISDEFSFVPLWRPGFVSDLAPEDRCHMTGMAMIAGAPRYAAVAALSDEPDGWRANIARGGHVIDVRTDETVVHGLSLPRAPRIHDNRLWLHESGSGWFGFVDTVRGQFERVAFCPGYLRGLDFVDRYAVCGISRTGGDTRLVELPLAGALSRFRVPAQCALLVIDTRTGDTVEWLHVDDGADEIMDVALLPGTVQPAAIGVAGDDIRRVLSIAPEHRLRARAAE